MILREEGRSLPGNQDSNQKHRNGTNDGYVPQAGSRDDVSTMSSSEQIILCFVGILKFLQGVPGYICKRVCAQSMAEQGAHGMNLRFGRRWEVRWLMEGIHYLSMVRA